MKVNSDDEISDLWKIKVMFQTTNQIMYPISTIYRTPIVTYQIMYQIGWGKSSPSNIFRTLPSSNAMSTASRDTTSRSRTNQVLRQWEVVRSQIKHGLVLVTIIESPFQTGLT